jgi:glycine/D-amino acid oxidase-like deaminating enzyme
MARIVIAGAGAMGASIAYHLAERGTRDVVLVDKGTVASGATAKAMGGVRQQFSTAAEVVLAQESIRFFESLGPPFFDQVGYLFVATTEEGLAALEERRGLQASLGVPAERVDAAPSRAGATAARTRRSSRASSFAAPSGRASSCGRRPTRSTWKATCS